MDQVLQGKITRENRDGTYDILFDDGERKSKVDAKLIKSLEKKTKKKAKSKSKSKGKSSDDEASDASDDDNDNGTDASISKGDRVEAKLKGWTKYYKGKITRENRDGTYDILFDDGERKSKVDAKLIKSLEKKTKKKAKSKSKSKGKSSDDEASDASDDDSDDDNGPMRQYQRVIV